MSPDSVRQRFLEHDDILLEVASYFDSKIDIWSMCMTCRRVFAAATSKLYEDLVMSSLRQCNATLPMLMRRPALASHVQRLTIRLEGRRSQTRRSLDDVCQTVRDVVGTFVLDALHTFVWDNDELPPDDGLWATLRFCCAQLRHVKTSVGSVYPTPCSHLFGFIDLRGFALYLRPKSHEDVIDFIPEDDDDFEGDSGPLRKRLWDMLIHRCPNLEELAIEGTCPSLTHARRLTEGRWPKLHSLSLCDIPVDYTPLSASEKRPFVRFLEEHGESLKKISLDRRTVGVDSLRALHSSALPCVTFYSGPTEHLRALPQLHEKLTSVTFGNEVPSTRDISVDFLKGLTSLRELKIVLAPQQSYETNNVFRAIVSGCPKLRHLSIHCGHQASFHYDSFCKIISAMRSLRTLELELMRYPEEALGLSSGAVRLARSSPHLECFSLTFLSSSFFAMIPKVSGTYNVLRDPHLKIVGRESRCWIWPIGVERRRYARDLVRGKRVGSHQSAKVLLWENSRAGEELRMYAVCILMAAVALWCCVAPLVFAGRRKEVG